jgi:hypothetical protein
MMSLTFRGEEEECTFVVLNFGMYCQYWGVGGRSLPGNVGSGE